MPNLTDYLAWRGDLLFDERPVNDADMLCLAALSYLDLSQTLPTPQTRLALSQACAPLLDIEPEDFSELVHSMAKVDQAFVAALSSSARFGGATIRAFTQIGGSPQEDSDALVDEKSAPGDAQDAPGTAQDTPAAQDAPGAAQDALAVAQDTPGADPQTQFAAMTLDLDERLTAVAFRGTDFSLVGWRENFMLGFTVTPAQKLAADYLAQELQSALDQGRRVVVCGHSKGGNLAEYACLSASGQLQEALDGCWSLDGPGTAPEVISASVAARLRGRLRCVRPSYSVVGQLFDRPDEPRVYVVSDERGILQHDPMSWQTAPDGLVPADGLDADAQTLDEALAAWMDSVEMDERVTLTNELFDVLSAGGAQTLEEIVASPKSVQRVAAAALASSGSTKQVLARLLAALLGANVDAARSHAAEALGDAWRSVVSHMPGMDADTAAQ